MTNLTAGAYIYRLRAKWNSRVLTVMLIEGKRERLSRYKGDTISVVERRSHRRLTVLTDAGTLRYSSFSVARTNLTLTVS